MWMGLNWQGKTQHSKVCLCFARLSLWTQRARSLLSPMNWTEQIKTIMRWRALDMTSYPLFSIDLWVTLHEGVDRFDVLFFFFFSHWKFSLQIFVTANTDNHLFKHHGCLIYIIVFFHYTPFSLNLFFCKIWPMIWQAVLYVYNSYTLLLFCPLPVDGRSFSNTILFLRANHLVLSFSTKWYPNHLVLHWNHYVFFQLVDKWYKSKDEESFAMARMLIRDEGLLCGKHIIFNYSFSRLLKHYKQKILTKISKL